MGWWENPLGRVSEDQVRANHHSAYRHSTKFLLMFDGQLQCQAVGYAMSCG